MLDSTITINDEFWKRYIDLIKTEMIPFQWNVLHDQEDIKIDKERDDASIPSEKSHAIENFRIAAGRSEGHHYGWLFQDSDVYKWLESAANVYKITKDEHLKQMMDEVIDLIQDAQEDDGYLSTFYQIDAPQLKFRRLFESHELYCAGHLIEAAVAHYLATDDDRLIEVVKKYVECTQTHFGPEEGKINGADGHQEIELALVKLYEVTKDESYLKLSEWFLEVRGQDPDFFKKQMEENLARGLDNRDSIIINNVYHQSHKPVTEQTEAVGHAVRLVYMAAAMADVAYHTKNDKLFKAAKKIWKNIVKKRMYITGGVGSTVNGEAFTFDFDLPNDTMYCETCAAIGLMFFAKAMMKNEVDAEYAHVLERALYNSVISGMALDGKHFFYVNPLEVKPESSQYDPAKSHVKATRPSWFGCACCPPNIARTLTSLEQYLYDTTSDKLYINLFMDHTGTVDLNDHKIDVEQVVSFEEEGSIEISLDAPSDFVAGIRIPTWVDDLSIKNETETIEYTIEDGYALVNVSGKTKLTVTFSIPVIMHQANPKVRDDLGKVALQRGPFVYCLEEEDNGNDLHLNKIKEVVFAEKRTDPVLGDFVALKAEGEKQVIDDEWENTLYRPYRQPSYTEKDLTFIPYHLWANRSVGEMSVWIGKK
ncbi:glycoside hydrolase family 127 protein [Marinilactibacillus kalidii]|uniref:glycoside hydrolase family 127 protein n=1 Tax=Marinilactibacillus kalidii TaxID=2820274 RepID=UPI001ABE3FC2|nr:beta-L-arabinofuranosidase domain-containing protein [Marinilactibacillus kalidii]